MVMGNFCPFHNGHKYLIDTSIENSEKVYVFVCHRKDDPISGNERFLSIKNTYRDNENIIVFNIEHDYDNYPGERGSTVDEFYDYWVNQIVYKYVDELDVVFTSEEYGDEFAEYLGVEHFLVDKKRKEYPISGTEIRNNPYGNWEFLPHFTKSYFIKKIAFIGPESSGKTTISKIISEHYNTNMVDEYVREYFDNKLFNKNTRYNDEFIINDIINIGLGQLKKEDSLKDSSNKMLICDTEIMTTTVWSEMYFGIIPDELLKEYNKRKYDLYFLMDIDFDWIDDGTREFPDKRRWFYNRLLEKLDNKKCNYIILSGSIDNRVKKCIKEIDSLIENFTTESPS